MSTAEVSVGQFFRSEPVNADYYINRVEGNIRTTIATSRAKNLGMRLRTMILHDVQNSSITNFVY